MTNAELINASLNMGAVQFFHLGVRFVVQVQAYVEGVGAIRSPAV